MPPTPEPTTLTTRRGRNRQDKWTRIQAAATQRFSEFGYDATTMRDIAADADVGFGTIFTFVKDKRDLLFSLFADSLMRLSVEPFRAVDAEDALLDQLAGIFAGNYELFVRNPPLARQFLAALSFETFGEPTRSVLPDRADFIRRLSGVFGAACGRGRIAPTNTELVAEVSYMIFSGAIRQWLRSETPSSEAGVRRLKAMLALQLVGLHPSGPERESCEAVLESVMHV